MNIRFKIYMTLYFLFFIFLVGAFYIQQRGDASSASNSLLVLNYGDYIDRSVLKKFEKQTGIHVVYEEYETPETMYAKYMSGSIDYDLICSSDYMVEKLMAEGETLPFDPSHIPNLSYIADKYYRFVDSFDPDHNHTIPYFLGTVGLLYNTKSVDKKDVKSWKALWNEKYKNQIIMENSMRDCLIPALSLLGKPINETDPGVLSDALDLLLKQKRLNYAYLSDDSMYEMIMENANLALIYSGEANAARLQNENLAYEVPMEGSNLWIDAWFIPKTCQHKAEAEIFLDFLCDPKIAYKNWDHVYYTTPNTGVYDQLDPEEQEDETMFPPQEVLDRCQIFSALSDEEMRRYHDLWKRLKVASP